MKLLKLAVFVLTICFMQQAQSTVDSVKSRTGKTYWRSSQPLPGVTNKTIIATHLQGATKVVLASPHAYYGNVINADIMWLYNFLTSNGVSIRWGKCNGFPYKATCLN